MSKIQIREGLYETNSSSVHAMSVYTKPKEEYTVPEKIDINLADYEFGWENETYNDVDSKVAYISLLARSRTEDEQDNPLLKQIKALLLAAGVKEVNIYTKESSSWLDGYVDHSYDKFVFLVILLEKPDLFDAFIFNPQSYVETGNDNDDYTPSPEHDADFAYCGEN